MNIRRPQEKLGDCCWLARIVDKVRLFISGGLPEDYAPFFCDRRAMDGIFLRFFGLSKEVLVEAVRQSDGDDRIVEEWFLAQRGVSRDRIEKWNELAPNIGRPGYPGHQILEWAKEHVYTSYPNPAEASAFEVMDLDEGRHL
jgi:Domain of unknown function (DUF5069)